MLSPTPSAITGSSNNCFTCALQWEGGIHCPSCSNKYPTSLLPDHYAHHSWVHTTPQKNHLLRAQQYNSHQSLEHCSNFNEGASTFLSSISPNMGDLIEHTQCNHQEPPHWAAIKHSIPSTFSTPSANHAARESVCREYKAIEASRVYGWIESDKPNNVIKVMYENYSSLSLFTKGNTTHKKIHQINKLMQNYGVDILAGCKTRTDWQFVTNKEEKFHNLFCRGQRT